MLIVTAANEPYYPGVFALWNSIQKHSPGHDFCALIYGEGYFQEEMLRECDRRGIHAIPGMKVNCARLPEGRHENNDPMYIRIQLPHEFEDEQRILWMDCDQIVVQPLDELVNIPLNGYPCGMVDTKLGVGYQLKDCGYQSDSRAGFAGLILMDVEEWIFQQVTEHCFATMLNRTDLIFNFVVQSVLNFTLDGDFQPLPDAYQRFGNRDEIPSDAKVIHWHGRPSSPWMKFRPVKNSRLWEKYATG